MSKSTKKWGDYNSWKQVWKTAFTINGEEESHKIAYRHIHELDLRLCLGSSVLAAGWVTVLARTTRAGFIRLVLPSLSSSLDSTTTLFDALALVLFKGVAKANLLESTNERFFICDALQSEKT